MSVSELKLIKRCVEFCAKAEIRKIPWKTRGLYILLNKRGRTYTLSCISVWHGVRSQECVNDSALMPEEPRKTNGLISRSLRCGTTLGKKRSRNWKAYCDIHRSDARANPLNEQRRSRN
jgi:hypothetical protein